MLFADSRGVWSDRGVPTQSSHLGPGSTWRRVETKRTLGDPKQPPLTLPATPAHLEREANDSEAIFLADGPSTGDLSSNQSWRTSSIST
jgi:hypothetical protein